MTKKKFQSGRGYTKKDWDDVNSPPATDKELGQARPFKDAFPGLHAMIKRSRGRPRVESPKTAVTLRVDPKTVERFQAKGDDWRARMARALEKAK